MQHLKLLLVIALLFSMSPGQTKSSSPNSLDVRQMMTAAEFNRAGLQKLTPDEVAALNDWLYRYSLRLLVSSGESDAPSGNAIESHIEGDFEGWSGDTVFKLDNGQIWQQASYAYTYHYAYHPKVIIYKDGSQYKMKVDGVSSTIEVKRLK